MFRFQSVGKKILALSIASVLCVLVVQIGIVLVQKGRISRFISADMDRQAQNEASKIALNTYHMVKNLDEIIQESLQGSLEYARDGLGQLGTVKLQNNEIVTWNAVNQATKAESEMPLPKMLFGKSWLGNTRSAETPVPVIDEVTRYFGNTCTVFQRMNDRGDMLRVATSVLDKSGNRAVGTYIPVSDADGSKNPVLERVLKGDSYKGRAFVVDSWYLTAYEPIFDDQKKVVGMLYAGVKQEKNQSLRQCIMDTVVGKTGYVFVLDKQGRYLISAGGKRDGEVIWEAKDATGRLFIQSMIEKALKTSNGASEFERYMWLNKEAGDKAAREKISAVTYYEPWDWVIGAGTYLDDYVDAKNGVDRTLGRMVVWVVLGGVILLALILPAILKVTNGITGPLRKTVEMIQEMRVGKLSKRLNLDTADEVGVMAQAMDEFAENLQTVVVDSMQRIADGDVNMDIPARDEKDEIAPALNRTIASIRGLIAEMGMLTRAAVDGNLNTRGNPGAFKGAYRDIVKGVNETLDAVIGPLNVAAQYVDRISKGDLPPKITDQYRGDFNEIKNNLNRCVDAVKAMIDDADMLAKAAVEGKLSTRADSGRHEGDFRKIVQGFNNTLDAVIGPLNVAADYVDRISKGDMPPKITDEYHGDFNELKNNLNQCIEGVLTPIKEAADVIEQLANYDMRARMNGEYRGDHAKIKEALNRTAENLETALSQVSDAVDQVSSAGGQIASSSQAVAEGASEQASSLEETSSSLEEMSGMTKQNADNARQANALAKTAKDAADAGNEAMSKMVVSMDKIRKASDDTSAIIKDINEIAFQTNLLALNAAVEAARAGDAGRGFAVVAEEVRNLALRAKEAAKKTEDLIAQSTHLAVEGQGISKEVSGNLSGILDSVAKVSGIVAEIAAASQEQARGIEQVNEAVAQMNKVTQMNAANSEESSSAAQELSSQAAQLSALIGRFQLGNGNGHANAPNDRYARAVRPAAPTAKASAYSNGGRPGATHAAPPKELIPFDDDAVFKEF